MKVNDVFLEFMAFVLIFTVATFGHVSTARARTGGNVVKLQ